jgi:hypothetical protein
MTWGVFVWRGDGHYPAEYAHRTYASKEAAEESVRDHLILIVREIPACAKPREGGSDVSSKRR